MEALKAAVRRYAAQHANADGLALTPVPGLRLMCAEARRDHLHTIYRPLVCLVLSGAKNVVVGTQERVFRAGQTFIISADMPVAGRIVQASAAEPFMALSVEFDRQVLGEIIPHIATPPGPQPTAAPAVARQDSDACVLDCAARLLRLVEHPQMIPILAPGIMRELHFWLLCGEHGAALRALAPVDGAGARLARAIAELRADFRGPLEPGRLAKTAGMGLSAFHKRFKQATTLTPGQFQKQLRLIEARRLMMEQRRSAGQAAFAVGYKSASQFTREYGRFFGSPPRSHALAAAGGGGRPLARGLPLKQGPAAALGSDGERSSW